MLVSANRITLKMAMRNLARHRGRSSIMLTALALFVSLCIVMDAVASGFYGSMTEAAISQTLGEAQIHAPGHLPVRDPALALKDPARLDKLAQAVREARVVAPRVRVAGMVVADEARPVDLIGATPEREREFGSVAAGISQGRYLERADAERRVLVMGYRLAQRLELEIGSSVGLMAGQDESPTPYELVGIFRAKSSVADARLVHVPIAALRLHLGLSDEVVTEVAIRSQNIGDGEVARALDHLCSDGSCEARGWDELNPALSVAMTTDHNFLRATYFVLLIVSGLMVLNLQLMSVLERTRELAMMMAIGAKPDRLFSMLVIEALTLGVLGVGAGLILGLLGVATMSDGLDMTQLAGGQEEIAGFAIVPLVIPRVDPLMVSALCLGALGLTGMAAIWPGLRLFKLDPLSAMRGAEGN